EAHDSPRDRAFVLKVAEALKPLGFTHFAAETFTNFTPENTKEEMGWLESAGYPRFSTGTYTIEPMFGYLVRRAMTLGYRPVAYEAVFRPEDAMLSREERIVAREQEQAENLAQALAAAGPDAKFLIHVTSDGMAYSCIFTYASGRSALFPTGRPWKRDRQTPAILLFHHAQVAFGIAERVQLIRHEWSGRYHHHGYELARRAI